MYEMYADHGIRFLYPQDWELSEQQDERDVVISVFSPETSFWMVSLLEGRPDPERVLREALEAFRGEYAEIDEYPVPANIDGTECEARDLQFVQYELINSAFLRACSVGARTALILYQGTDHELASTRPTMEDMTASLKWDEAPSGGLFLGE